MTGKAKSELFYPSLQHFQDYVAILQNLSDVFEEETPPFETRYKGRLESIIAQIQAEYFGKELYIGVVNKAVWLFYCLATNHPFFNGNKRIAVIALYDFLKQNTSELYINESDLFDGLLRMAIRTANSKPEDMERTKRYLKRKIRSFILEF
jgi:death on curing protein